jgi:hypothetical protein
MTNAVYPVMKVDEGADRTDIGRGSWAIGLARDNGEAAEIQAACDSIKVEKNGAITVWSLWDENAELRDEPLLTMALAPGTWTYFHVNDPFGMPLAIEKTLAATQSVPAVR